MKYIRALTEKFFSSKWRSRRQKVLAALMAIVVFCTTYALILPAITLDSRTAETEPGIEAEQAAGETLGPVQDESHLSAGQAADVAQTEEGKTETAFPETAAPAWTEADTEAAAKTETAAGRKTDSETAAGAAAETAGQTESTKATEPDTEKDTDTETQTEEIYAESPLLWKSSAFDVEIRFDSEDWQLPEGTTLTVKELKKDTDTWNYYDARARKELKALDKNAEKKAETVSFYELTLSSKGKEIAMPKGAADLTISYHHDKESVYKNAKIFGDEEELLASLFWHAKEDTILFDKNWDNSPVISLTDHRISKIKIKDLALADFENVIGLFACPQTEAETETELKMPESAVTETEEAETKAAETEAETEAAGKKAIDENGEKAVSNTEIESALETETETKTAAKTFTLTAVGKDYTVTVNYGEQSGVPEGALLKVSEIKSGTGAFDEYLETARETIGRPEASAVPAEYARFFDITILADGQPVEPAGDVDVKISFHQPVSIEQMQDVSAVHFGENGAEQIEASAQQSEQGVENVTFAADSFSVYGVVYTVDFEYEWNGQMYRFSLSGGEKIKLSDLVEVLGILNGTNYESVEEFIADVQDVEFSDPELVKVSKKEKVLGVFGSEDWVLESLKPFDTEETLTITMGDGSEIKVIVRDEQTVAGNNFITDAQLTIDGTTYGKNETWHVFPDVDYTLKLSFAEKGSTQFPKGGDTIVVDLPAGLTLNEDGQHHSFDIPAGLAGTITGNEYWVENGKLYVKFGPDPDDILTRSSNAHFNLTFNASFAEGTSHLEFNGRVNPTIEMDTTADVSVDKSATYNSATGKMDYTITVKSTGNSKNVVVRDAMATSNLLTIDQSSITVTPAGTSYTTTPNGNGFNMNIPSIGHNETVTIKYSADVNESALDHKGNIKVSDDGKNTVTVENDDNSHDEETNTYTHQIKYSNTAKTSVSVDDHETASGENKTATIEWKITVNDNYRGSIVGDKITDTIDYSNRDAMKYTKNSDGTVTLNIVAKSQNGTTYTRTVNATVTTNSNGQESWEYTIPQMGNDPNEILSYEISYTTEVDKTKVPSNSNGVVKNDTTNEGDGSATGTGVVPGVTPHGGDEPGEDEITGGKAAVNVTPDYIDWDIVVAIPPEGYTDSFVIVDEIPNGDSLGRKFADTFDSILSVTGLHDNEDYTYEVTKQSTSNLSPKQKDILTITFYQNKAHTDPGLDSGSTTRTVTIRIRTKNDPDWVNFADTAGGGEQAIYHTNRATVNNVSTFTDKAAPLHTKIDKEKESTLANYTDTDGTKLPQYEYSVVLTNVSELPIVITDTYNPDELVFVGEGQATGWTGHHGIAAETQKNNLNNPDSSYHATFSANDEAGVLTITANDLPKKPDGSFYEFYKIYYTMRIKDAAALDSFTQKAIANGGSYKVGNTAEWNGVDDHVDIEFTVPAVEKTGSFKVNQGAAGNDRLYDFAIDINEQGLRLNGGEPMDLTDTHTPNLTVDYTTVKVYKYVNGEKTLDSSIEWNFDGNIGTFYNLQDETHYTIEYSCLVIGTGNQAFSNYAEMNGFHDEKHDSRNFGTDVDAGATVYQIGLIKYQNGMTSRGLAGATFQLFRGTGNYTWVTEGEYTWGVEEKEPMTWGEGVSGQSETAGKVGQPITFTTDENGYVKIALDQSRHGAELEEGVHYYLKEIESPPGYQIDSSVEYWEFTLTMDPDEVCYGTERDEYNNRKWIYFYYDDILKMNNTETTEPLTVSVDKEWFDIDGNKVENPQNVTAKVQLYQKTNTDDYVAVNSITSENGTTYPGLITLPVNNNWEYTWEGLPRRDSAGNVYAYKLEEVEVTDDYVSTSSLDETEDQKDYHFKNYQVKERKVNVSVSKTWKDADGNTIQVDQLPTDIKDIRFNIYRVVSRAPFTTTPTSGGNPYVITGSQYYDADATEEDGMYCISRNDFGGVTFENLPSVEKVTEDGTDIWYFYSYYVKEVPVEGYDSDVAVEETTDTSNNKILISSITNNKQPEPMDLTVEKKWKNKTGEDVTWPNNKVVQFELYQVSSREPFEQQPDSGGTLFDAEDYLTISEIKVSGETGLYQLGFERWGSQVIKASFNDLPAVTYNARGVPTYYAYYVKEIAVDGYETTYTNAKNESGDGRTITITNQQEPESTQISVEKKWYDQDGTTEITDATQLQNLSAEVELVRYRAEQSTAKLYVVHYGNSNTEDWRYETVIPISTDVGLTITCPKAYQGVIVNTYAQYAYSLPSGTNVSANSGDSPKTYHINTSNGEDLYLCLRYCGDVEQSDVAVSAEDLGVSGSSSNAASIDDSFEGPTVVLSSDNNWSNTFSKLPVTEVVGGKTYVYTYGIREVSNPAGFEFMEYNVEINEDDTTDGIKASVPAGSVVVKNKKTQPQTTEFTFYKEWKDNETPQEWPTDESSAPLGITVQIGRSANGHEDQSFSLTYTISGTDVVNDAQIEPDETGVSEPKLKVTVDSTQTTPTYQFCLEGLEKFNSNGDQYTYFVKETAWPEGYEFKYYKLNNYTDQNKGEDGWSIVNKTVDSYELPSTGGPGTRFLTILGSILIDSAGALLLLRRRRLTAIPNSSKRGGDPRI